MIFVYNRHMKKLVLTLLVIALFVPIAFVFAGCSNDEKPYNPQTGRHTNIVFTDFAGMWRVKENPTQTLTFRMDEGETSITNGNIIGFFIGSWTLSGGELSVMRNDLAGVVFYGSFSYNDSILTLIITPGHAGNIVLERA